MLETVSLNLKFTAPDKNQTTAVVSPAPRRYTCPCLCAYTPPTQISTRRNFKVLFSGTVIFADSERGSLHWGCVS